uniref:Nucleoporin NUP42 n=1 Tax=Paramormyrops kingsleyae TaxID=1676925 RepID=A0A3B3RB97_9TELE|nr:uncharacterized protein LOC111846930 [Paramormyrops kingsleyae]XP_023673450.1 uncharacterized protein LOC111846930 [Paramormyrops kingsleyae]XP_023673458.1 uncharacterized protein LOC111846930 [Paramormyrops kingsleyae]XP_023673466.1 uncharacterized protein LOC111846930 [Paramormyrops kingsleyae]
MKSREDCLQEPEKENRRQPRPPRHRQPCRFYSQGKNCQFGENCHFLHQGEEAKQALKGVDNMPGGAQETADGRAEPGPEEGESCSQAHRLPHPGTAPHRRSHGTRPCRYFLSGHCALEDRCRFWHPDDLPPVAEPNTRPREPVEPPSVIHVRLSELTEEVARRLRDTEITQLAKRFPRDQLIVQEREDGQLTVYRFIVHPSDPDWPFDLKEIHVMVSFPEHYPQEVFNVLIPEDQDLPSIMGRHVCKASQEWLQARHATNELMEKVELLFRPFLRWLDRNLERLFTEGARQLKKDIDAERSGIQFISYQQLQASVCKDQRSEPAAGSSDEEEEEEEEDDGEEEDNDTGEAGMSTLAQEEEASGRAVENMRSAEPRRGTEVKLLGLQLGEGTATVRAVRLTLSLQCNRCKVTADLAVSEGLPCSAHCDRCSVGIGAAFRPNVLHRYCDVLGYLDLSNSAAVDLVLQECELMVGCLECSQEGPLQSLSFGQNMEVNCLHCHSRLSILVEGTRFQYIQPRTRNQTGQEERKQAGRYPRDPAVQHGKPLPGKGTCKHFKQSQRWLRFPCCGRAYPCDLCHDSDQDHPMERATRMLCGHCAKEQPYNNEKPCISCGNMMTRGSYTSHWEGGLGCRNKVKMSRNDRQKFSSANKTVSRKAKTEKN